MNWIGGDSFEGIHRLTPKQEVNLRVDTKIPRLVVDRASTVTPIRVSDLNGDHFSKMRAKIKVTALAAELHNHLPTAFPYDHATFTITIPETHMLIETVSLDSGLGFSYLLLCQSNKGKKYILTHILEMREGPKSRINLLFMTNAVTRVVVGENAYHLGEVAYKKVVAFLQG